MLGWFKRKKKDDPKEQLAAALGDFSLPNFPAVANRVLGLLRDPDVPLDAAGDALSEDPGVSAKLLGIANSSAFALRHPVRSVGHATSLLGRSTVESLLLGVVVQSTLPKPQIAGFDQRRFWRAAARRASAAKALADVLHPRTKSESFTASLREDMAVPLIGAAKGGDYGAVLEQWHADGGDLADLEREALGFDHAVVAGWVAQSWKLPENLADAIGSHHDVEALEYDGPPPAVALVAPLGEDEDRGFDQVVEVTHARFGLPTETVVQLLRDAFVSADEIAARMT